MNWKPFDVVQVQSMPPEQRREPVQRVVEQVFMVNRIELTMLDHIQSVSEFEDRDAGRLQKARKPGDKIIDVVYMSDHVVRDYDIRELAFACQLFGASRPEEIVNCRHANARLPALQARQPDRYRGSGIPRSTKLRSKYPSLLATSTTKLCGPSSCLRTSASTCSAECFSSAGEDEEKYG